MKHQNTEFYVVQAKRRAAWTSTGALDSNWQEALRRWPRTSQCRCGVLWRAWLTLMSTLWLSVALRCGRDCPHWGILLSSFIGVPSHSCSFCSADTCSLERWNKLCYLPYYYVYFIFSYDFSVIGIILVNGFISASIAYLIAQAHFAYVYI